MLVALPSSCEGVAVKGFGRDFRDPRALFPLRHIECGMGSYQ
jgi:hypothetical protein